MTIPQPEANGRAGPSEGEVASPGGEAVSTGGESGAGSAEKSGCGEGGGGRQRAVAEALACFEGPLIRYAVRLTGDGHRGRDVVQETFLRLCREGEIPAGERLAQWLYTVCRRLALDVRRKENRMKTTIDMASPVVEGSLPSMPVEQAEQVRMVLGHLRGLSENQQEVVRLKFQSGLSYKQISGVTGLSVSNVGFLLHTAIKTLRDRLKEDAGRGAEA